MGLSTWKRQIKGTDKYKVASELLLEIYRVREGVQVVRSPLVEYSLSEDGEGEDMKNYLGYVEALDKRWRQLLEPTAQLSLASLKAEVHLGKDVKKAADELLKAVRELQVAFEMHLQMRQPGSGFEDDEFNKENSKTLWAKPTEDLFMERVKNSIKNIERLTRDHL